MVEIRRVDMEQYLHSPKQYKLVSGESKGAPLCPYGNHYEWIGYDTLSQEYVRYTKSVFKLLMKSK